MNFLLNILILLLVFTIKSVLSILSVQCTRHFFPPCFAWLCGIVAAKITKDGLLFLIEVAHFHHFQTRSATNGPFTRRRRRKLAGAFLTVAQLARRWHISEHRLYQMRKSGEGPLFTIVGRIGVRYLVNAVVQDESTRTF